MQLFTDWWGVTVGADTEEDVEILRRLAERLPSKAKSHYEDGDVKFAEEDHVPSNMGINKFDSPVIAFLEIRR